jgi:hypothetical protein
VRGIRRTPTTAALDAAIRARVEREAARDHCSYSLVVRNALAFALNIKIDV